SLAMKGCVTILCFGTLVFPFRGATPFMSPAVNSRPSEPSGPWIERIRPWATGLRRNAISTIPGSARSATNRALPCRNRSSSLRSTEAPTPVGFLSPTAISDIAILHLIWKGKAVPVAKMLLRFLQAPIDFRDFLVMDIEADILQAG